MPPFAGNETERKALAAYIMKGIHGKSVQFTEETPEAVEEKGKTLFETHCVLCHSEQLVKEKTASWDRKKIRWSLDNLNRLNSSMPDYTGTAEEKEQVADYIFSLQGGAR